MALRSVWETIYQGLEEQRRIVEHLKRYEDVTYTFVVRRFTSLQQDLTAIFRAPGKEALIDRRVQKRRQVQLSVARERRRRADRRRSIAELNGKGNMLNQPCGKVQ